MIPNVSPYDIMSPLGMEKPYENAIRLPKEGLVLAVLVNNGQKTGNWKSTNGFPKEYFDVIEMMEKNGTLVKINDGHIPSQNTVELLKKEYSSKLKMNPQS